MYSASLEVLGLPKRKHQDWFHENNTEVQLLIDQMHNSHKCWLSDNSSSTKREAYKKCKGMVQKSLRQMKEAWWSAKATQLQDAANRKDAKAFYEGLQNVYGPNESGTSPVLSSDGEILHTDKTEILLGGRNTSSMSLIVIQWLMKMSSIPSHKNQKSLSSHFCLV